MRQTGIRNSNSTALAAKSPDTNMKELSRLLSGALLYACLAGSLPAQKWVQDPNFNAVITDSNDVTDQMTVRAYENGFWAWGGNFTHANNIPLERLLRLNESGEVESAFVAELTDQEFVQDIAPLSDGSCWVLLWDIPTSTPLGFSDVEVPIVIDVPGIVFPRSPKLLIKLRVDGSRDPNTPELEVFGVHRISALDDGGLVAEGNFDEFLEQPRNQLARIKANGQLDPDFVPSFSGTLHLNRTVVNPNGLIYISYQSTTNNPAPSITARLLNSGQIDPSFTLPDTLDQLGGLTVMSDEIAMHSSDVVYRFNSTGKLLSQTRLFPLGNPHLPIPKITSSIRHLVMTDDGSLIVLTNNFLREEDQEQIRFESAITLSADNSTQMNWQQNFDRPTNVRLLATRANGSSLVSITSLRPSTNQWLPRHVLRESTRPTWSISNGAVFTSIPLEVEQRRSGSIIRLWEDSSGRVLAAGNFTSINDNDRPGLARFLADGQLDLTFAPPPVTVLRPLSDGGAIVRYWDIRLNNESGVITGTPRPKKLLADGRIDPSFAPSEPHRSDSTNWLLEDDSGNLLISSYVTDIGDGYRSSLVWLDSSGTEQNRLSIDFESAGCVSIAIGSIQTLFVPYGYGSSGNPIRSALRLFDGQIMVQGYFNKVAEQARHTLVRLTTNGELDSTYHPDLNEDSIPLLLSDGSTIIRDYDRSRSPSQRLLKLTPAGVVDNSFQPPYLNGAYQELRDERLLGATTVRDSSGWPDLGLPSDTLNEFGSFNGGVIDQSGVFWLATYGTRDSAAALIRFHSTNVPGVAGESGSVTNTAGESAWFHFKSSSSDPHTIKWFHDDVEIPDQTTSRLRIDRTRVADAGNYHAEITYANQSFTTAPQALQVTANTTRLVNFSARSYVTAEHPQIMGFVPIIDDGRPFLIRALGLALVFAIRDGQTELLAEPFLRLHSDSGHVIARDIGSALDEDIEQLSAQVGAFPARPPGPLLLPDFNYGSALSTILGKHPHTASVTPAFGGPGLSLLELYDASTDGRRGLSNLSIRGRAETGSKVLTGGFVIRGNGPARVLIRAVGPTLSNYQVNDAAPDPSIRLFSRSREIASNTDWRGDPEIVVAAQTAGAFELAPDSFDAAILVNIVPGAYTAQVDLGDTAPGEVLLEVYHLAP